MQTQQWIVAEWPRGVQFQVHVTPRRKDALHAIPLGALLDIRFELDTEVQPSGQIWGIPCNQMTVTALNHTEISHIRIQCYKQWHTSSFLLGFNAKTPKQWNSTEIRSIHVSWFLNRRFEETECEENTVQCRIKESHRIDCPYFDDACIAASLGTISKAQCNRIDWMCQSKLRLCRARSDECRKDAKPGNRADCTVLESTCLGDTATHVPTPCSLCDSIFGHCARLRRQAYSACFDQFVACDQECIDKSPAQNSPFFGACRGLYHTCSTISCDASNTCSLGSKSCNEDYRDCLRWGPLPPLPHK